MPAQHRHARAAPVPTTKTSSAAATLATAANTAQRGPKAATAAADATADSAVDAAAGAAHSGAHVTTDGRAIGVPKPQRFRGLRQPQAMRIAVFTIAAALAAASALSVSQLLLPNLAALRSPHALAEIPGNTPLETCLDDEAQLVQIDELYVDPFPPAPGANLTVSAKGTVKKDITDGAYVDVLVRYGFITLVNRRYDLCELLPEVQLECPVDAGFLSLSRTIELPDNVPPGEYSVEVKAFTVDDELLTCLAGTIEMDA